MPAAEAAAEHAVPWLIIPTFNEAENVTRVVDLARTALSGAAPEGFRILIVDDGSPDGTGALADALALASPDHVQVLHRERPEGLGPAYLAGFAVALSAGATYVMEMDADLSHDPRDLARLLGEARRGADLVLGSRYVAGGGVTEWGVVRRFVSRGGSWYARRVLGIRVKDVTGGFKCFRSSTLRAIDLATVQSKGYAFQVELTWRSIRSGLTVVEAPIVFRDRTAGRSKMNWRIAREAIVLIPALRRSAWRPPPGDSHTVPSAPELSPKYLSGHDA